MNGESASPSATLPFRIAAGLGFLGVALGAFGAHALKPTLAAFGTADVWVTAVHYHLVHTVAWNMMLPAFGHARGLSFRDRGKERELAASLAVRLGIKGDLTRPVQALSGGNQQKVALAKWMPSDPPILLLNDPTRGVDVETKREIYVLLRRLAGEGKAVVLSSSDTPELVHLCDRVAVMREGRIVAMLDREALSEEAIVSAAMGAETARAA